MVGWFILAALLGFLCVLTVRALRFAPLPVTAPAPVSVTVDENAAAHALSVLIQCITVSHADSTLDDNAEFEKLEALLPQLYPRVHATCTLEKVDGRGLIYRWKGITQSDPLVLTAHYDVVPVEEGAWQTPPFSGEVSDDIIHGRGALDTKCTLAAILTAAETLIEEGFEPQRDVYFCFAGNEEVMGPGASRIVATLAERGVRPLCVIDEGGAIVEKVFPGVSQPCALIGVAEKGSANYLLSARAKGGHSSAPLPHTPIDMLAAACLRMKQKPFAFRVTKPAQLLLNGLARHSSFAYRLIFANLWAFAPLLNLLCLKSGGELNALFRTTVAFTVFHSGDAANVLPASAEMTLNVRVLPGETMEGTLAALKAKVNDPSVDVSLLRGLQPSACSGMDGLGYAALAQAIGEVYPGVLVSPYMMIACSDARHYERICPHVYRFSGMPLSATERRMIHGVDEQIPVSKQADAARFFTRVIVNACGQSL